MLYAFFALTVASGCTSGFERFSGDGDQGVSGVQAEEADPDWTITAVAGGLDFPWDLFQASDGTVVFTQRGGQIGVIRDHKTSYVSAALDDVYAEGESGLMGIVADPAYDQTRRFYTCFASVSGGDIRVVAWTMAADYESAEADPAPIVQNLPLAESGRHGGCRLRFDALGELIIGTGDSTNGSAPQSMSSLGGKTLRVNALTGQPPSDNPFIDRDNPSSKLIFTLGHRNVQGLALRPSTGAMYSVEHGPDVDDEINLLSPKANYGWDPDGDGSAYDESVPMTDKSLGGVTAALWSSGDPTLATSGATFLDGKEWGELEGSLLVATLKGERLLLFDIDKSGHVAGAKSVSAFDGAYGRLRTVQAGTDGSFFVTTSNGQGDQILKVTPVA